MRPRSIAILIIATLALCIHPGDAAHEQDPDENRLRVLVWNVLHGANDVDEGPEKALAIIRSVVPDIVLLQESYDIDGDRVVAFLLTLFLLCLLFCFPLLLLLLRLRRVFPLLSLVESP